MQHNDEDQRNVRLGPKRQRVTDDVCHATARNLEGGEYSGRARGDSPKSKHSNYFKRPSVDHRSSRRRSSADSSMLSHEQRQATRFQSGPGPNDKYKRYPSSGRHYNWSNQKNHASKSCSTSNDKTRHGEKSCKYFKKNTDGARTITVAGVLSNELSNSNRLIANESTNAVLGSTTENQYKPNKQDLDHDSKLSGVTGDLDKLHMMTAADFDRDRYARYGVHETEIKDYVRTVTFLNSIDYCADQFIKNKVVLVVRSGIGFLPLLCARNGFAKRVIALEESACIEYARRIVKDNNYSHKITLIQSSVKDLKKLPHGLTQVDVIVSDFLGECIISQGDQMEQVIEARDRFLSPNGIMIPKCVSLYGQLSDQRRAYENRRVRKFKTTEKNKKHNIPTFNKKKLESEEELCDSDSSSDSTWCSWWKDVYGFDMRSKPDMLVDELTDSENFSASKKKWCVMSEPIVSFFDPYRVVSNACLLVKFNMHSCTIAEVRHIENKDLKFDCITPFTSANGGDYAHMLELFMIVDFPNGQELLNNKDAEEIGFSTSCFSPYTRYRQTGLLLRDQLLVEEGDEFTLNEFHMWRGPQENQENKLLGINPKDKNSFQKSETEEHLKLRLRYTFVNKYVKAIDRRCVYVLPKQLY